ncbi:MAG: hydroxyacylglutathione hydrolase [Pseudobdellovibrio sp.]
MISKLSSVKVELIPIFENNYVFLIINTKNEAIIVDPGEASLVIDIINIRGLLPVGILITHHHLDHIGGLELLKRMYPVPIYAPLLNKSQIILADHFVSEADSELTIGSFKIKVIDLPGHTLGHIAYWFYENKWLFSGDVLFGLGCGRLFEGSFQQMFESLQKIKTLPMETLIYCTHEYTASNLNFCKISLKITNDKKLNRYETELLKLRNLSIPSVPLSLGIECTVNPFLTATSVDQFAQIRKLRNNF